jgi:hypothetical protein
LLLLVPATALPQGGGKAGGGFKTKEKVELRKYDEVVTKDAKSTARGRRRVSATEQPSLFDV